MIIFANGSKPCIRAVSAFVFRFFLKGKYKSSKAIKSLEVVIFCSNSDVKTFCSSNAFKMAFFRFSKTSNTSLNLTISPISTSSKLPVISFLYLDIKGIVASSFSNEMVFSTDLEESCVC